MSTEKQQQQRQRSDNCSSSSSSDGGRSVVISGGGEGGCGSKKLAINKSNRRPFQQIPIFVVEDHNDVLQFIYRCLGAHRIPFTKNKIIHFDSHPDMTIPKYMPAEFVRDREKLLQSLSIENWLMPVAYAGHIDQLIWIKPEWATQIPNGDYTFWLGDYNGYIRCDSKLEYFLSEATYQPRYNLNDQRQINLRVFTLNDAFVADMNRDGDGDDDNNGDIAAAAAAASGDKTQEQRRRIEFQDCVDDTNEKFILDIDLDFFSTTNPFKQILSKPIYAAVKCLFKGSFFNKFDMSNATDDELMAFTVERSNFLDALETVFKQLDEKNDSTGADLIIPDILNANKTQIHDLIRVVREQQQQQQQNESSNEIAWMTIFDAGCTFDSNDLPHHISTEAEIIHMVEMFKRFLIGILYTPCIITVSRSSDDDYCPVQQVDFIQKLVLQTIHDVYRNRVNTTPILHYAGEEWTV